MIDKNKAIRKEKVRYKCSSDEKYKNYYVYIFNCLSENCNNEVRLQSGSFGIASGKCKNCVQKGEPYEALYNQFKKSILKYRPRDYITFDLSYEEFKYIAENYTNCHYCGKEVIFSKYSRNKDGSYASKAYQLDRKDNFKGYYYENVVSCCWECNRLKSNIWTYEEFMRISPILMDIRKKKEGEIDINKILLHLKQDPLFPGELLKEINQNPLKLLDK